MTAGSVEELLEIVRAVQNGEDPDIDKIRESGLCRFCRACPCVRKKENRKKPGRRAAKSRPPGSGEAQRESRTGRRGCTGAGIRCAGIGGCRRFFLASV